MILERDAGSITNIKFDVAILALRACSVYG